MSQTRTILVITDSTGTVIGAGYRGEGSVQGLTTALSPLPGQRIHEVEIPDVVARLSGRDFHFLLSQARFEVATAKLELPKLRIERRHHEE